MNDNKKFSIKEYRDALYNEIMVNKKEQMKKRVTNKQDATKE